MRSIKESMKSIKEEKGSAGLEFTLVFPFLLFVAFGIIEFGALMFNKAILTNAAREGARAAIVYVHEDPDSNPTCAVDFTNIETNARNAVIRYLQDVEQNYWFPINDPSERQIEADDEHMPVIIENDSGEYAVNVKVFDDYHFIFLDSIVRTLLGGDAGASLRLMAEAEMRGENNYRLATDIGVYEEGDSMSLVEYLGRFHGGCGNG